MASVPTLFLHQSTASDVHMNVELENVNQTCTIPAPSQVNAIEMNILPTPSPVTVYSQMNILPAPSTVSASQINISQDSSPVTVAQMNTIPTPSPLTACQMNNIPTPSSQSVPSQPSAVPALNNVTTVQLKLPDLVQVTENNKFFLRILSAEQVNGTVIKPIIALPSNSLKANIAHLTCIPDKAKDPYSKSINDSNTILPVLNVGQLRVAQGNDSACCLVANPNSVLEKKPKLENGSDSNPCIIPSIMSCMETKAVLAIKVKQEPKCGQNCSCGLCSTTPMASTSGVSREVDNQGFPDNAGVTDCDGVSDGAGVRQNHDNMPPVSVGSCLMCGGDCDSCGRCDEDDEDVKPFVSPPPMVSF
jgi:hypothetical protein